jgi:hypothetical protein
MAYRKQTRRGQPGAPRSEATLPATPPLPLPLHGMRLCSGGASPAAAPPSRARRQSSARRSHAELRRAPQPAAASSRGPRGAELRDPF